MSVGTVSVEESGGDAPGTNSEAGGSDSDMSSGDEGNTGAGDRTEDHDEEDKEDEEDDSDVFRPPFTPPNVVTSRRQGMGEKKSKKRRVH